MRYYRLTLLMCVFAWFMIGLHVPAFHQITAHGTLPGAHFLIAVAILVLAGVAALWMLMRAPVPDRREP